MLVNKRIQVLWALVGGTSTRATVRMTGLAKNAVTKLLRDVGRACTGYHDAAMPDLSCRHVQVDEIWSFRYAKRKKVPQRHRGESGYGDVWTWVAIDADAKLVPCWVMGEGDAGYAVKSIRDLASRLAHRVQLTTGGLRSCVTAIDDALRHKVDWAQL